MPVGLYFVHSLCKRIRDRRLSLTISRLVCYKVRVLLVFFRISLNNFYLPFVFARLPFDWKTSLFAYLVAFSTNVLALFLIKKVGCVIVCHLLGSFLLLLIFFKDIKQEIELLNESWKTNQNQAELKEKLCEILWFNARINE